MQRPDEAFRLEMSCEKTLFGNSGIEKPFYESILQKEGAKMAIWNWLTSVFMAISMFFSSIFGFFGAGENKQPPVVEPPEPARACICGVCHPSDDYAMLKDAGLDWVRFDIPYPYNKDGSINAAYTAFKNRAQGFAEQGIKVLAITPYPKYYFNIGGFDPSAEENAERTKEIAVFLLNDLRSVIGGLQISNEMGVASFTMPLTLEQAAKFVGIQAQAISEIKGDLLVGYNSAGVYEELHRLMQPYLPYMDYVGIDLYYGTLSNGSLQDYVSDIRKVNELTGKPVMLTEFGYASAGRQTTAQERAAILASYGYSSEAAVRADIVNFIAKLPDALRSYILTKYPDPAAQSNAIFHEIAKHFYGHLDCSVPGIPHTQEGQAEFFRQLLPLLKETDCLAGFFIFSWKDYGQCPYCGRLDCPYKSVWGITDANGEPKAAYYAVRDAVKCAPT